MFKFFENRNVFVDEYIRGVCVYLIIFKNYYLV